jgi:hypothetical protein
MRSSVALSFGLALLTLSAAAGARPRPDDGGSPQCGKPKTRAATSVWVDLDLGSDPGSDLGWERAAGLQVEQKLGRLPPEVIQRVIRQSYATLRRCYEDSLGPCPAANDRVTVQFRIHPSTGRVDLLRVVESTLAPRAEACVLRVFRELQFPLPEGGGPVVVSYPFRFAPGA